MPSLTRDEAIARALTVEVLGYAVELDVDTGPDTFESTSTVTFRSSRAGASTFLDVRARTVHEVRLNGRTLDPDSVADGRIDLDDLAFDNVVTCRATMAYSRDGQGLHRAVDPADDEAYLYGNALLAAAPRIFGCFDQPDLKAPYTVAVTGPPDWTVVGNGVATQTEPGRWSLVTTPPLATYFVTVCAGRYVTRRAEHDGIPLALHARQSLSDVLDRWADQIFTVTRQGLDRYHGLFGIRYPFGEYHQVFVPEFNAGAMENPGCVTISDDRLFRGSATDDALLTRARTIEHELAHMWFGDLVTMRWWDDLWLNESFAEYMATTTLVHATEFHEAWTSFGIVRKTWGYAAERRPSTHPVAGSPALDAASALQDFDGIAYAKGASVVRQLVAYLGEETSVAGVSAYLREHAYGNGTFADLVGALERASGRELGPWCDAWLRTADRDRLRVETVVEGGVIRAARLHRLVPPDHPADRTHVVDVVGWTGGVEQLRTRVRTQGEVTELPELVGRPLPKVLLPNASDLTWAGIDLDPATVAALPGRLSRIPEGPARVVVWSALVDAVSAGTMDPRPVLALIESEWVEETSPPLLERLAGTAVRRFIPEFLLEAEHDAAWQALADAASSVLARSEAGSNRAIIAARTIAECNGDAALLRRWLDGVDVPEELASDSDFRWLLVGNLARRGLVDDDALDAAEATDPTFGGRLAALQARASQPTEAAKAWAWSQVVEEHSSRSNHELVALLQGLWATPDLQLVRPYVGRFFAEVPRLSEWVGDDALARVVRAGFPRVVERASLRQAEETLAGATLSPATRRNIVDGASALSEAVVSRERYAPRPRALGGSTSGSW
ncbi:MAG: aminopeptidase N [Lapillicoccus sp.]